MMMMHSACRAAAHSHHTTAGSYYLCIHWLQKLEAPCKCLCPCRLGNLVERDVCSRKSERTSLKKLCNATFLPVHAEFAVRCVWRAGRRAGSFSSTHVVFSGSSPLACAPFCCRIPSKRRRRRIWAFRTCSRLRTRHPSKFRPPSKRSQQKPSMRFSKATGCATRLLSVAQEARLCT